MGCLVIGGEDHTIRQERQSQGSVPNLAKLPIWLHVKGLVNWYLDLGGSCSTSNCWAKLTKLPVLEVFFLTKFREKLISYLGPILQVQPSWKSVHRQMALLFQILDQWNGLYLSSLWENLKKNHLLYHKSCHPRDRHSVLHPLHFEQTTNVPERLPFAIFGQLVETLPLDSSLRNCQSTH